MEFSVGTWFCKSLLKVRRSSISWGLETSFSITLSKDSNSGKSVALILGGIWFSAGTGKVPEIIDDWPKKFTFSKYRGRLTC